LKIRTSQINGCAFWLRVSHDARQRRPLQRRRGRTHHRPDLGSHLLAMVTNAFNRVAITSRHPVAG
jgi:hypothetical protein